MTGPMTFVEPVNGVSANIKGILAYAWRERYLASFNDEFAVPRFTDDYGQLDLSVNDHVNSHLSIQAQILNLTEEQRINLSTSRYLPYAINAPDRRLLPGVRITF